MLTEWMNEWSHNPHNLQLVSVYLQDYYTPDFSFDFIQSSYIDQFIFKCHTQDIINTTLTVHSV